MNIEIEWHNDQFNVNVSSKPGMEAFLSIKGCRLVNGNDGSFIGYPATKNATSGKWWKHVWGSDKFNAVVLEKVIASKPQPARSGGGSRQRQEEPDSDIPFGNPLAGRQWSVM